MRYEEVRRQRGVDGVWLRLKVWLQSASRRRRPMVRNLSHLPDHIRCDIGLPEQPRYVDWRALRANGWR